jgi:hypothetical protein
MSDRADPAELLDVEVNEFARVFPFTATHRFEPQR